MHSCFVDFCSCMFQVSDFKRDSYEHNGLCGRNESVPLAKSAGSGRDVFGNKNGVSSEGGSRTKIEQNEGAAAVSGRVVGAVHRGVVLWCCWYREKKTLFHGILHSKVHAKRIFLHFH